jgi:hypothetical protein
VTYQGWWAQALPVLLLMGMALLAQVPQEELELVPMV